MDKSNDKERIYIDLAVDLKVKITFKVTWYFKVSIEHMQRVRHANRGRLLLRTPGPVPLWDLHVF